MGKWPESKIDFLQIGHLLNSDEQNPSLGLVGLSRAVKPTRVVVVRATPLHFPTFPLSSRQHHTLTESLTLQTGTLRRLTRRQIDSESGVT